MQDLPKLIRYFKDCYEADNRDLNLWNVFHTNVEHTYFVPKEEEVLSGHLPILPLPETTGSELETSLILYEREKELYYMSFLLLAKGFSTGLRGNTIISPLLLHPANIEVIDGDYFARPDLSQRHLNTQVIRRLQNELNLPATDQLEELQTAIPGENWELNETAKLSRLLQQWLPGIDVESLFNYPELFSGKKVKSLYNKLAAGEMMVVPASLLGITAKGDNIRSIINDLEELCESNSYSTALQSLFYPTHIAPTNGTMETGHLPVLLNAAQEQIIKAANTYPISQITGPPGTGKSYTIAAMAAELASKGQKVLIASRTDAAMDVVYEKIEQDLKLTNIAIRGGKRGHNRKLYNRISGLLSGRHKTIKSIHQAVLVKRDLKDDLDALNERINILEASFNEKVANEMEWGEHVALNQHKKGIGSVLKNAYIALRNNWQDSLGALVTEIDLLLFKRTIKSAEYLQITFDLLIAEGLENKRPLFQQFSEALNAPNATANEQQLENLNAEALLNIFPIWVVNVSDLRKILPMKMEMFDVAIIDEATQCDTACFLSLLQRAKRVVVAGDPKQLRHISFLSYSKQRALMDKHGLGQQWQHICNYRDCSLLDVTTAALQKNEQVSFLNEHYRSRPAIIQFSNREFYDRQLNVMTEKPGHEHLPAVFHYECKGTRDENGCNHAEAEAILLRVAQLLSDDSAIRWNEPRTIGIISPFRKQADYLAKRIADTLDSKTIRHHRIMVGTAYSFQGAERDVMLLSLALDHNSHHSAFGHANKPDVFNVSITRAKAELHVFSSLDTQRVPKNTLLQQYLEYLDDPEHQNTAHHNQEFDQFQHQVMDFVKAKLPKAEVRLGYTIAGLVIDVVVLLNGKIYGIDLIGYPGPYEEAYTLERYRMYSRAGVFLFPLAYSNWIYDREECVEELTEFLK